MDILRKFEDPPKRKFMMAEARLVQPRVGNRCVASGPEKPCGLPGIFLQGIMHGGIIGSALDEAMSNAVAKNSWKALTAGLRVGSGTMSRLARTFESGDGLWRRSNLLEPRVR